MGDIDVVKIKSQHILSFLKYMRTDYVPRRIAGDNSKKIAPKTLYNIYVSLASFLTWASNEFNFANLMKNVPRPRVLKMLQWSHSRRKRSNFSSKPVISARKL